MKYTTFLRPAPALPALRPRCGTIYDLQVIAAAGPGDEVRLLADQGAYKVTKQITIAAGGAAGAPVTIRSATSDGTAMAATIVGTRATGWKPGLAEGIELFRLVDGADHLKFADLATKNIGNGVCHQRRYQHLSIKRVAAPMSPASSRIKCQLRTSAGVNWLKVETYDRRLFAERDEAQIQQPQRDAAQRGRRQPEARSGLILAGVALDGARHRHGSCDHAQQLRRGAAGDYWNGDGFVAEGGTYNLTFRDTVATGNTDAGYDIKGNNVTMLRASASGNNKNFRLWGAESVTMTDSVSANPYHFGGIGKPSHFQAASGANVTLDNFRYADSSTAKVFDCQTATMWCG
jgi:hypothetical protein